MAFQMLSLHIGGAGGFHFACQICKHVDQATYFYRFYDCLSAGLLKIWPLEETKHPGPHSKSFGVPQKSKTLRLLTFAGTLFGDISALFPMCFCAFFRCAPRWSFFRCWCQTRSQTSAFGRRFHDFLGSGQTCENRALVLVLARFRGLEALPNRRIFRTFSCVLIGSNFKRHFVQFS